MPALGLGAMILAGGCQTTEAQQRRGIRPLAITHRGGYLEFVARDRRQEQESKVGAGSVRSEETVFEESIKLYFDGYTYHPNLMEFTLGALLGLQQHDFEDQFDGRRRTSDDEGPITEFDFEGRFFKRKAYPGTVFARRYRAIEPRPFQPSIETTTTTYGFTWQYVDPTMPTSLQYSDTEVKLDPLGDVEEEGRQRNRLLRFDTQYIFSDRSSLSFLYEHRSTEEEPFDLEFDSDELTLTHRFDFGPSRRHRLESELNYFDQRGTFDIERLRWREILRLQHSDTLRSWYRFELLDRTQGSLSGVPPLEETSVFLTGTVEHKLYDSLVTQLLGFAEFQDFNSGLNIDRYGGQLSFDYRKKNPWGVLLSSYRVRIQQEDRDGSALLVDVVDEVHTFNDPRPVVLSNTYVIAGSIIITAEDRFTIFQSGRDYTIARAGDRTEIRRVPTGRILDGQTVLIDYVFQSGGDFLLDTIGQEFWVQQNFPFGLSPYYRFRYQDETVSPEDAAGVRAEDIEAHIVGAEYRKGPIRLAAEYEDHDSTIIPFRATRLTADYSRTFANRASAHLKTRWTRIDNQPPNERLTRFFTIEGRYRHPLTGHLTFEGVATYRNENDSLSGRDEGFDVELLLEWIIRETELRIEWDYGEFDDDFSRNDFSTLYVQLRRRF